MPMVGAGIALLGRKQGVGIEELTSSTGWWLPRTARAALIRVVIDNVSIHSAGALYDAFPAPEARRTWSKGLRRSRAPWWNSCHRFL